MKYKIYKLKNLNEKVIEYIKCIERKAYPSYLQQMQDISSKDDIIDYTEYKPIIIIWDCGYMILTKNEIVDLASLKRLSRCDFITLLKIIYNHFKSKKILVDLRGKTTYRFIDIANRYGLIKIIEKDEWYWDGEIFYSLAFKFNKKNIEKFIKKFLYRVC